VNLSSEILGEGWGISGKEAKTVFQHIAVIEPLDLSAEERQKFRELLGKLTRVIQQRAEEPKPRPMLRLLPYSRSGVDTTTPEHE
jgi:hypothetical protein